MGIIGPTAPSGPAGGSLEGTYPNPTVKAEGIETAMIKNLAIIAEKIAANAVEFAKAKRAVAPVASGTESLTAELGTNGVHRTAIAVYNAKAEASAKIKIKHNLQTEYVHVSAWKATAKKATTKMTDGAAEGGAISQVKAIGFEEVEITLVATIPVAKEEIFYLVST